MNGDRDLNVIYLNIRAISANGDALNAYMSSLNRKFYVICLSKT